MSQEADHSSAVESVLRGRRNNKNKRLGEWDLALLEEELKNHIEYEELNRPWQELVGVTGGIAFKALFISVPLTMLALGLALRDGSSLDPVRNLALISLASGAWFAFALWLEEQDGFYRVAAERRFEREVVELRRAHAESRREPGL